MAVVLPSSRSCPSRCVWRRRGPWRRVHPSCRILNASSGSSSAAATTDVNEKLRCCCMVADRTAYDVSWYSHIWNSRSKHEYLLIYSFERNLLLMLEVCFIRLSTVSPFVAKRYILQQKCPNRNCLPSYRNAMAQFSIADTDPQGYNTFRQRLSKRRTFRRQYYHANSRSYCVRSTKKLRV